MSIELAVLVFVIVSALYFAAIRTHISYTILALAAGYLLSSYLTKDLASIISNVEISFLTNIVSSILLLMPMIVISYHFKNTQKGFKRFMAQLVPALAFSLLLAILLYGGLTESVQTEITDQSYIMRNLLAFDSLLVAFAFLVAFFDIINDHNT